MTKEKAKWKPAERPVPAECGDWPAWFVGVLRKRKIRSKKEIEDYLSPDYEKLVLPENFKGIEAAAERIAEAQKKKETVCVFGDYDVDGVTAVALVFEVLERIGLKDPKTYIPHRLEEGYGLNKKALSELKKQGVGLVVAVDCGINSGDVIDAEEELDFIVVDHHEIDRKKLSQKAINIHPHLTEDKKKYHFSGAGLAFLLARAVQKKFEDRYPGGQEKWLLDLVALSVICDIVPLIGDNRILATWGLRVLAKTKRPGLLALADSASIDLGEVGAREVGFVLGPRLNAAGRIEQAETALELLLTGSEARAGRLAKRLEKLNTERQKMCERIVTEAKKEIEEGAQKDHKVFLLSNKNWPRGVVGIVASRIADEHNRPVIVFEDDGENHHGSARSVDGFDIVEALAGCGDCLKSFGGHAKAAGLVVSREKFVLFSDKLVSVAGRRLKETDLKKTIEIDAAVEVGEVDESFLDFVSKMEPFGCGNTQPVFLVEGVLPEEIKRVGQDSGHLKFSLDGGRISGIAFKEERKMIEGEKYDLVGGFRYSFWGGRKRIEFLALDFRSAKPASKSEV